MRFILTMLTLLCVVSCQNTISEEPLPETITVSFNLTGDFITEGTLPLTTASSRSSADDIIAIQVYQRTNTDASKYKPHCYGLWNDLTNVTATLNKDMIYRFEVTIVPNARNIVAVSPADDGLMQPFSVYGSGGNSKVNNRFIYSNINYLPYISQGTTALISGKSYNLYTRPTTDRYYGELSEIVANESLNSISIPAKRVVFGLQYNITGFTEGVIKVQLKNSPDILITPINHQTAQTLITFQGSVSDAVVWASDDYSETIPLTISWKKASGDEIEVTKKELSFRRKTLYTVRIDLDKLQNPSGLNIEMEDGTLNNGGNI